MTRYIFVTGGVSSSLGKGLAAASLGALLQARGYRVCLRKFDPYINVDPGTMSPYQHGEVFVTDDGAETDLDLGHYERFTGIAARSCDAVSTGQVYSQVIARERRGDYLGATVMVVPHITDAIQDFIQKDLEDNIDFLIVEIGGTVGDIEGLPFIEAIRQFAHGRGEGHTLFLHLTLVPFIASAGELKTKPAQHSVKELQRMGIQPHILLCRSEYELPTSAREKLALYCNIPSSCVIEALDVDTIYQVPLSYSRAGLDTQVLKHFGLDTHTPPDLTTWERIVREFRHPKRSVALAVVGKYTGLRDAYKSLAEALVHGGLAQSCQVDIDWIHSEDLEEKGDALPQDRVAHILAPYQGLLVPGGHGDRGIAGKMAAIQFARENQVPYLGICLGMQLAFLEFARHVMGLREAVSSEFSQEGIKVVGLLTEWRRGDVLEQRSQKSDLGGTMRLGAYPCLLEKGTRAYEAYGCSLIEERHRHRYEVDISYQQAFEEKGLKISGVSPDGLLPEMIELLDHPWFVATQGHPELKSTPFAPHPLFKAFVKAADLYAQERNSQPKEARER